MTTIHLATEAGVSVIKGSGGTWSATFQLSQQLVASVAIDPGRAGTAYCGTVGSGLYKTADAGLHWSPVGALARSHVSALAFAQPGFLFAGTEPSEVLRSDDSGSTWMPVAPLTQLASASQWSFPPRPHTHHVQRILPDRVEPAALRVAVEAGALVRSHDGGAHWLDRVVSSPRDTHWLLRDPHQPRKLFSAAGDGFFQSDDGGEVWEHREAGLEETYCWSLALGSGPAGVQLLSAAKGAYAAHYQQSARSSVYRREGDSAWYKVSSGLPESRGHRVAVIAECAAEPDVFYLSTEGLVFRSCDAGKSWSELAIDWRGEKATHAVDIAAL